LPARHPVFNEFFQNGEYQNQNGYVSKHFANHFKSVFFGVSLSGQRFRPVGGFRTGPLVQLLPEKVKPWDNFALNYVILETCFWFYGVQIQTAPSSAFPSQCEWVYIGGIRAMLMTESQIANEDILETDRPVEKGISPWRESR
jgi:hypothetical protein